MATQREMCELHADRMDRIESKLDTMIEHQAQIRVEIAKLKSHTRIWAALMSAAFTAVTTAFAAAFKS